MKFLDIKTDYAFKKVFGSANATHRLKSMLNAILEYPPEHQIEDLSIADPYQIPRLKGMKDTYVDVKARLSNGKQVIIEMQVLNVQGLEQRILYNAAKHYAQQLQKGEDYTLLNPVIGLTFVDFELFPSLEGHTSRFKLIEKQHLLEYSDDIELVFIELPKFNLAQPTTLKDKWLYLIKHAGELDQYPAYLDDPCITEALETANEGNLSQEELELQERRYDFIRQQRGALALAKERGFDQGFDEGVEQGIEKGIEQGMEKGIEQGIAQGMEKSQFDIARKALAQGMALDVVSALTGVSLAQLRSIQQGERGEDTTQS